MAVLVKKAQFALVGAYPAFDEVLAAAVIRIYVLDINEILRVPSDQLVALVAEQIAQCFVDIDPCAVERCHRHAHRRFLDGGAEPLLAALQRIHRPAQFGDVGLRADHPQRFAVFSPFGDLGIRPQPDPFAVDPPYPVFGD